MTLEEIFHMTHFDAEFTYSTEGEVLKIVDLDLGNQSVTNDAENVLQKIQQAEGRSFVGCPIMYRDSMKVWDRLIWDGHSVRFFPLREEQERAAYDKLCRMVKKEKDAPP